MQQQVKFGSRGINFTVQYRERKTFGIKVYPDCRVEVLAPIEAREDQVFEKVRLKAPWILKQIDHFNTFKPSIPPRRFINGETHLYLGRQYRLKVVPDEEDVVKVYRGQMLMHSNDPTPERLKAQLGRWYKQKAFTIFNELLKEVLPKFKGYDIAEPALMIRTMSQRWGSCTASGKIILNTELIKAPKGCIEYVIIHELCHLVHHNHTKAFQDLQSKMLPDWRKWKDRLEYTLA
jgi:predicted metal-dependent hydrolase